MKHFTISSAGNQVRHNEVLSGETPELGEFESWRIQENPSSLELKGAVSIDPSLTPQTA